MRLCAQEELPQIVRRGIEAIGSDRADSAFRMWSKSAAFGSEERDQIVSSIPMFKQACGAPRGYDHLRSIALSPHIQRIYLAVRCDVRPVYVMLALYRSSIDWTITALNWNTDPDRVLPAAFFGDQRP
jgi:hypothetical protein